MRERESHENDTEVLHHARYPRTNQSLGNDRALKDPAHWKPGKRSFRTYRQTYTKNPYRAEVEIERNFFRVGTYVPIL